MITRTDGNLKERNKQILSLVLGSEHPFLSQKVQTHLPNILQKIKFGNSSEKVSNFCGRKLH